MNINYLITRRIKEVCRDKHTNISEVSIKGGLFPNALYELTSGRTKSPTVATIKLFCEGAGITLREFFNPDYFDEPTD